LIFSLLSIYVNGGWERIADFVSESCPNVEKYDHVCLEYSNLHYAGLGVRLLLYLVIL
jgi:hypothetical protein